MLKQIKGSSYYFDARVCIGIYIKDGKAILVDTGMDDDYARKVCNSLQEKEIQITKIITTHAHGDHYGGNSLIKSRTGCRIYAPRMESVIMENPILEPIYLYGADPIDELKDKFFMGKPSIPDEILGKEVDDLKIIEVPGHSMNTIAVLSPDSVLFANDSFFSEEVLSKYKVPYLFDVQKSIESLNLLFETKHEFYLVAHGGLLSKEQAKVAISKNIELINQVADEILDFLKEKNSIEGVLTYLAKKHDMYMAVGQYFLNLSIVKAYLSYLKKQNKISCFIEDKQLYWKKI
ncbi:MAG: MBL fold metallo-hydrolase [archaeon]